MALVLVALALAKSGAFFLASYNSFWVVTTWVAQLSPKEIEIDGRTPSICAFEVKRAAFWWAVLLLICQFPLAV